jgi:hypothetical protein
MARCVDQHTGQQISVSEVMCFSVGGLQLYQEGENHAYMPLN